MGKTGKTYVFLGKCLLAFCVALDLCQDITLERRPAGTTCHEENS